MIVLIWSSDTKEINISQIPYSPTAFVDIVVFDVVAFISVDFDRVGSGFVFVFDDAGDDVDVQRFVVSRQLDTFGRCALLRPQLVARI